MEQQEYQNKMALIKKIVFIVFIVSVVLAVVSVVLLGLYHAMGILTIHTGNAGSKYERPFTYPGWQQLYGFGGEMIIQGYNENSVDILMIIALFLPLFAGIITTIMMITNFKRKGTNRKKAILEFVMAGALLFGAICFLLNDKIWIANASRVGPGSYANYYEDYLLPAIAGEDGGYFRQEAYPVILGIVCIVTAIIKAGDGALLLFQKSFAKKNAPAKIQIEVKEN